jgi:glycosyltransferase involved in cell wall biosynthesis
MSAPLELSIVVPILNEEESLPSLYEEIAAALATMGAMGRRAEIIFVDDRSTDGSLACLLALHQKDPRVCVVRFRRNYGQTAALAAGFDVSRGRVVVTLDGDLQNDPADIPALVRELERGYDIVAGWRRRRHDGFVLRRLPSFVANRLIAWVTGVAIHDTGCTLKAFRRELVKSMAIYAEQHRFLPVLSAGSGARISEIVVNHRARRYGRSKYGIARATRVVLDLMAIKFVAQFSQRPIQYFGTLSLGTLAAALLFALIALISLDFGQADGEGPWNFGHWEMAVVTILCILFSAVVYFALLGLLGELAVKASGMHRRSTLDRILNELH